MIRGLVEHDGRLWLSRSWTTRARRDGEPEDAYTFVTREEFLDRVNAGGFLEWATVLGEYYGTPLPDAPPGRDVVLEIDVQGAEQVRERCEDVVCVLLVPPSTKAQEERLRQRGDDEEHIARRISLGSREIEAARGFVDAVVVNDDLDRAIEELAGIVEQARGRFSSRA